LLAGSGYEVGVIAGSDDQLAPGQIEVLTAARAAGDHLGDVLFGVLRYHFGDHCFLILSVV
jgi:hypothetical protein